LLRSIFDRRVLRSRRRRRGLNNWDFLEENEECADAPVVKQQRSRMLGLWDSLDNIHDVGAKQDGQTKSGKRGLCLWDVEEYTGATTAHETLRKCSKGLDLWNCLKDQTDHLEDQSNQPLLRCQRLNGEVEKQHDPKRSATRRSIRLSSKLSSWDFMEDLLPNHTEYRNKRKKKSGFDTWDCLNDVSPTGQVKKITRHKRRGCENWSYSTSVDASEAVRNPVKKYGFAQWDSFKGLDTTKENCTRSSTKIKRGLSDWDAFDDVVPFLKDGTMSAENSPKQKSSKGIGCWDFLNDC